MPSELDWLREEQRLPVALEQRQRHGQPVGVLVDLVAALLPSFDSSLRRGMIGVINCMMIEAVMYGYTPSATIEKFCRPLPEKRFSIPSSWFCSMKSCRPSRFTPGTGMLAMNRKMTSIASVKRILPAQIRNFEGVEDRLEHRLGLLRRRVSCRPAPRAADGPPTLPNAGLLQLAVQRQAAAARAWPSPSRRCVKFGNGATGRLDLLLG